MCHSERLDDTVEDNEFASPHFSFVFSHEIGQQRGADDGLSGTGKGNLGSEISCCSVGGRIVHIECNSLVGHVNEGNSRDGSGDLAHESAPKHARGEL